MTVDDYGSIRKRIKSLIRTETDIEVVGEAETGVNAVQIAQQLLTDVVIMDFKMPGLNGSKHLEYPRLTLPLCVMMVLKTFWTWQDLPKTGKNNL